MAVLKATGAVDWLLPQGTGVSGDGAQITAGQEISSGTEGLMKTGSSGFRSSLRVGVITPAGSVVVGMLVGRDRRWGGIGNPAGDFVLLVSWDRRCGGIGNPARELVLIVAWWC